ncbi:MAG: enoyl-[acyl-carrier-protein] reductase [Gammaproteobacteria bacterium RIFCSPLOWO2_02_FULL_47_50]|jgi:enoyl-[acyl-carrier protein] reductase I|nr:MAG: enoyl-[acyl-carrier-protein] reductase [Gammaproteobacteria bacterium RIFCSPLOWO2_01_FULL_47_190]OGT73859.1 MAG: enoyl-[acyl-carrier-protein] reductase [Gammaproteobacteria bacterium RIFCSPLOWO2_12_47_11]OGT80973.1 MAG: enoyl-[acyl-carrier-protein] reductase [Gammaproteobacteria bacterium RIFCSPLOWO2_02_FULL_47_50]OGT84865.1 MAG: enoyl-[acyl-carrier-protein] reductase [Gammaproteobacteria bacterium RIFCSPLOWO2_12_FULL_47_76]
MGLLEGKRALIVGVASNRSIAWGIAKAMRREGADLAFTYQNEKLRERVESFAAELDSGITVPCDVASDEQIQAAFDHIDDYWDSLDILVHSIAFAPREQLEGSYLESVTREGFLMAHEISSYSFTALGDAARPMMKGRNGAMLTLSYIGAVRAMPNYNVMGVAKASLEANVRYMAASLGPEGIRVNAISAGPIRTLAASGISGLRDFLAYVEKAAPLRRNVTIDEVGNVAAFLCSDYASAVTGEITYVDCGYNAIGAAF